MKPPIQIRNRFLLTVDLLLIVTAVLASFALRLELGAIFTQYLPSAWVMVAIALVVKPIVYYLFGLYRRYWVYASTRELRLIVVATATASVCVAFFVLLGRSIGGFTRGFPRSVLGIDWLLSLFSVGGVRLIVRMLAESGQVSQKADGLAGVRRVVVVGAGDAGVLVVRELQRNPQMHMLPVAFVDDDAEKLRKEIHGVPVDGRLRELASVVNRNHAHEVVIAIPTAPGHVVRLVTDVCRARGIPFRTMPGMYELIGGKVSVSRLREVDISDLLRRQPASIDDEAEMEIPLPVDLPVITVWVGYVPVVIVPELTLHVGAEGHVHAGIQTAVAQEARLRAGLAYRGGAWSPISQFSNEFYFTPPQLYATADLKGYAAPQLELLLYGMVGPYASVEAYLKLEADLAAVP